VLRTSTALRIWDAVPSDVTVPRRRVLEPIAPVITLVGFLLTAQPAPSQSVVTLSVDFTRKTILPAGEEPVSGTIHFRAPEEVTIIVDTPVLQWSRFQGADLLIYYPLERRAFRFVSRNRLMIPFAQSFVGLVREDFGLPDAGFTLRENRIQAGVLTTVWSPPRALRTYIGEARIGMRKYEREVHPLFLEFYGRKENLLTRITYLEYREDLQPSFPGRILILQNGEEGEVREEIRYSGHRINESLPPEVINFHLAEDVPVEELKW
jgi:hypothetical protein